MEVESGSLTLSAFLMQDPTTTPCEQAQGVVTVTSTRSIVETSGSRVAQTVRPTCTSDEVQPVVVDFDDYKVLITSHC